MIKAVFFDCDNTLYDFERAMRHGLGMALQSLYERLPSTRAELSVEKMVRLRDKIAEERGNPSQGLREIRVESFRRALKLCGYSDETAPEIADIYFTHRPRGAHVTDDTLGILRRLRERGCVLAMVSNGNTFPEELGIAEYFDYVFFSEELGIGKPDPEIFDLAMRRVPCEPEECLHVGDSPEFDILGARAASIRAVWFNPNGAPYPEEFPQPDFEIADLSEVLEIVENL